MYASDDSVDSTAEVINADTLGGKLPSEFAPSGYGLGNTDGMTTITTQAELDAATKNGWYKIEGNFGLDTNGTTNIIGILTVDATATHIVQTIKVDNCIIRRFYGNSFNPDIIAYEWSEWEWENPPLVAGVRYRTTERYYPDDVNGYGGSGYGSTSISVPVYIEKDSNGVIHKYTRNSQLEDWEITLKSIGAAPAGYGLGENGGKYCDDINTATVIGWYYTDASTLNLPDGTGWQYAVLLVERPVSSNYVYQTLTSACGFAELHKAIRHSVDGGATWQPWEWINPPMTLGVEYRTTERYLGKPVYTKIFNTGSLSNGGTFAFKAAAGETVRYTAKANGYILPYYDSGNIDGNWSIWCNISHNIVTVYTGSSISSVDCTVQVWYTHE